MVAYQFWKILCSKRSYICSKITGCYMYQRICINTPTYRSSLLLLKAVQFLDFIFTSHQQRCRKVMFWQVSVCHSVGVPMWPLSMMHWSLLYRPLSRHGAWGHWEAIQKWDMGIPTLLVTSGGHHWRPVQTCSLDLTVQAPLPHVTDIWWPLKHVWLVSRRYAFCWNAFLLICVFCKLRWTCLRKSS